MRPRCRLHINTSGARDTKSTTQFTWWRCWRSLLSGECHAPKVPPFTLAIICNKFRPRWLILENILCVCVSLPYDLGPVLLHITTASPPIRALSPPWRLAAVIQTEPAKGVAQKMQRDACPLEVQSLRDAQSASKLSTCYQRPHHLWPVMFTASSRKQYSHLQRRSDSCFGSLLCHHRLTDA